VHPSPAAGGEDLPDRAALDALRDDAKRAEEALSEARGKAERAGAALAEERGRAEVLRASLGSAADQDRAALESALGDMESRAAGAEAAESERQRISGEVADLEARIVALRGALEAARGALRSTEADKAAVHATLRGIEERVPEAWRDPSAHARAAREAERLLASLSTAREAADVRLSAAVAALAAAVEREGAARTVADRTAADAARRASAFAARREEAGFASPSEYAEAKLDDAEAEMLDRAIEDWKAACAAAKDREARAEAAARGVAEPDLPALEAAAEAAGRAYDSASKAAGAAQGRVEHLEGVLAKLAGSAERSARLEAEYGVLCGLSQAASGDNEMRLTFQSWVLGALLDDVLIATSARLREMSGGRYALQRSRSVTDRRRAAGLDLDVSDAYTGLERPATTLSGGESFMAALALALGLADVVQSQSGGIRLDTIFIDEGFGSLDPEALDLALRVLSRLHEGGRLVGIISHVPELKRRIDARLEVTAGKTGSRAGFVL
jgi:exonuclease SbcC